MGRISKDVQETARLHNHAQTLGHVDFCRAEENGGEGDDGAA